MEFCTLSDLLQSRRRVYAAIVATWSEADQCLYYKPFKELYLHEIDRYYMLHEGLRQLFNVIARQAFPA